MDAIIFDLDGVLVSTDHLHFLAWKQLTARLGIPFDGTVNNRLRGVSRMESLDIILEQSPVSYSQEEKEHYAEEKNRHYRELLQSLTPADLPDGVRETLTELKLRQYLLAVGSSSKNTKFIINQIGLSDCFDAVSDGTNITRSKPNPEVFLKAAEYLAVPPEQCIVVEDAYAGVDAAKAARMLAIGIGDAATYEKADFSIQSLPELPGIMHKFSAVTARNT